MPELTPAIGSRAGGSTPLRIAYVTDYDSTDVRLESGLGFNMGRAFERRGSEVRRLALVDSPVLQMRSAARKAAHGLRGRTYIGQRSPVRLRAYAKQVATALGDGSCDVIVGSKPSPLSRLDAEPPIVLWTDTMAGGLIGFYPEHSRLAAETVRDSLEADQRCLDRVALAIFSSEWAAGFARESYAVDPAKIKVVPFGANLEGDFAEDGLDEQMLEQRIADAVTARGLKRCELVFVGGDWERKGGDVAIEVSAELNSRGIPTRLTIVGTPPAGSELPDHVCALGFVDKSTPEGRAVLERTLARSHFLVLPTQVDCCPIALAEANSFGVPCLTTNIAGIPTVMADGVNGQMFDPAAPPTAYAEYVAGIFGREGSYAALSMGSYRRYRTRLNWRTAATTVTELLRERGIGRT